MPTPLVLWALAMTAVTSAMGLVCWRWRRAPPQLRHATLLAVLDVYKTAWEQQDAALIAQIAKTHPFAHPSLLMRRRIIPISGA
jgi:hypothetical protein